MTVDLSQLPHLIKANPVAAAEQLFYTPMNRKIWTHPDYPAVADQRTVIEAAFRYRFVAFGTGHGISKTESTSVIIPLWMLSHIPSYVIVTSASWINVESRIFPALRSKIRRLDPHSEQFPLPLATKWTLGDEWECLGISPDQAEVAQGWHSPGGTLGIVDEASSVDPAVLLALLSLNKSPLDSTVLFGNPIRAEGEFANILRREKGYDQWKVFNISSLNTPNCRATLEAIARGELTDEAARGAGEYEGRPQEIIQIPGLCSYSYCRGVERKWGSNSAVYSARVLGIPPDQSEDTLIAFSTFNNCCTLPPTQNPPTDLMVDVAWSEVGDQTVLMLANSEGIVSVKAGRGWAEMKTRGEIKNALRNNPTVERVFIDRDGVGGMLFSNLLAEQRGEGMAAADRDILLAVDVVGVAGNQPAADPDEYSNVRAESWVGMKDAMKNGYAIPAPMRDDLVECTAMKYLMDGQGRIRIQPKDKFKEDHGHSPDHADCLALRFARAPIGERLWAAVEKCRMTRHPTLRVTPYEDSDFDVELNLNGLPRMYPGIVLKACVFSRFGRSGAVEVFIDTEHCWTVLSVKQWPEGTELEQIAREFLEDSRMRLHRLNLFTSLGDIDRPNQVTAYDHLTTIAAQTDKGYPSWVDPTVLNDGRGVDEIGRMIATTAEVMTGSGTASKDAPMLAVWPREMLMELKRVKLEAVTQKQGWNRDEDRNRSLVNYGGPLIAALRLLIIDGAGYL